MTDRQFYIETTSGVGEAMWQLFLNGPTQDGDLISKDARNYLYKAGYVARYDGLNFLTMDGVVNCVAAGFIARKEKVSRGK